MKLHEAVTLVQLPTPDRHEYRVQDVPLPGLRAYTFYKSESKADAEAVMANYVQAGGGKRAFRIVEKDTTDLWVSDGEHRHGGITRGLTATGKPYTSVQSAVSGMFRSNRGVPGLPFRIVQLRDGQEVVIATQRRRDAEGRLI